MALRSTTSDGQLYFNGSDVEAAVGTAQLPFQLAPLFPQTPAVTVTRQDNEGHDWVRRDSLLALLDWYAKTGAPSEHLPGIGGVQRALRSDQKARRAVARKHRWTIAYRQQYCCALCNQLLHPHSFEIDHKQELRDGGKDALDNLQALCSNCHARKTRTWARGKARGKARGTSGGTSGAAAL